MCRLLGTSVLVLIVHLGLSQNVFQLPQGSGDCTGAIHLKEDRHGPTSTPKGSGKIMEVGTDDDESLYWLKQEHHTTWYKFQTSVDQELTLEIIPVSGKDDMDFLLFEAEGEKTCELIRTKELKPIRSNISRTNSLIKGVTGLSPQGRADFVHSGPGNPFSNPLNARKGRWYYLVIDHYSDSRDGHFVNVKLAKGSGEQNSILNGTAMKRETADIEKERPEEKQDEEEKIKQYMNVAIFDAENGQPINANLSIIGLVPKEPVEVNDVQSLSKGLKPYRSYTINCSKKGYMYSTARVITTDEAKTQNIIINLQPIKEGEKIRIQNIKFKGDEAEILPQSEEALSTLLRFMEQNEDVMVEIGGHVNARRNTKRARQLSKERAAQVYYHLILKDIPKSRMTYKGYGNTRRIYEEPDAEYQARANRRVEIRILSTGK